MLLSLLVIMSPAHDVLPIVCTDYTYDSEHVSLKAFPFAFEQCLVPSGNNGYISNLGRFEWTVPFIKQKVELMKDSCYWNFSSFNSFSHDSIMIMSHSMHTSDMRAKSSLIVVSALWAELLILMMFVLGKHMHFKKGAHGSWPNFLRETEFPT